MDPKICKWNIMQCIPTLIWQASVFLLYFHIALVHILTDKIWCNSWQPALTIIYTQASWKTAQIHPSGDHLPPYRQPMVDPLCRPWQPIEDTVYCTYHRTQTHAQQWWTESSTIGEFGECRNFYTSLISLIVFDVQITWQNGAVRHCCIANLQSSSGQQISLKLMHGVYVIPL